MEWRTKDQSNVKVYDQKRTVDYADYKVGLFYISPFDLFVEGEPVITKLEKKKGMSVREGKPDGALAKAITIANRNLCSVGQGALIQQSFGRFSDLPSVSNSVVSGRTHSSKLQRQLVSNLIQGFYEVQ